MKSKKSAIPELVRLCCSVLDEKKAGDLEILDVSEQSSITDYLVIATATSEPHLRALRMELEKTLDANRIHVVGTDTGPESGWMVIDAFDVMVHLFMAEARERYGLERLWRDAVEVSLSKVLGGPERPPRAKKTRAPAPAKPRRKRKGD